MIEALAYFFAYLYAPMKAAMVPVGVFSNAIRGGRYLPEIGTAKKLWLAAFLLSAFAAFLYPPHIAVAIGLVFVIWDCLLPWGRYFTLNRLPRELSEGHTLIERLIERVSDVGGVRRDRVAFFIRNVIAFTVALVVLAIALGEPMLIVLAVTSGNPALLWSALAAANWNVLWLAPVAALAQNLAYEIGWAVADRVNPRGGINYSEHVFGAMWGAAIGFGAGL